MHNALKAVLWCSELTFCFYCLSKYFSPDIKSRHHKRCCSCILFPLLLLLLCCWGCCCCVGVEMMRSVPPSSPWTTLKKVPDNNNHCRLLLFTFQIFFISGWSITCFVSLWSSRSTPHNDNIFNDTENRKKIQGLLGYVEDIADIWSWVVSIWLTYICLMDAIKILETTDISSIGSFASLSSYKSLTSWLGSMPSKQCWLQLTVMTNCWCRWLAVMMM